MNAASWLARDLRYAVRSLLHDRGTVALALLALSLGIGATTVVFSVVYSILINPSPYREPSRIVHFYLQTPGQPSRSAWYPAPEFAQYRTQNDVFSHVLGGTSLEVLYAVENSTYRARGAFMDPHALEGLGVTPILGRGMTEADGAPGAPPTFLMTDRMWNERFNRDPGVMGMTLDMNGTMRTLIGVLPPRVLLHNADVFFPATFTAQSTEALLGGSSDDALSVWTYARLKPGVTMEQAAANLEVIGSNLSTLYPNRYPDGFTVELVTLADAYTASSIKELVYILVGAVLMLLMIASSNVANLLLVRATAREAEFALRASLGASRWRLMQQLLVEGVVLVAAGTGVGTLLAYAGILWVRSAIPADTLPAAMAIQYSTLALLAAVGVTMTTTLLCGLVPAFRVSRGNLQSHLTASGKGVGLRSRRGRLRAVLVAVQVTLAIVLLVGAGLMMRTLFALQGIDPGVDTRNVLTGRLAAPETQLRTGQEHTQFIRRLVDGIRTLPGVVAVSPSLGVPLQSSYMSPIGLPGTPLEGSPRSAVEFVGEDYFRAVGMAVLRGRALSATDVEAARPVVVVNASFVREFLDGADPIGRTVTFGLVDRNSPKGTSSVFEIVGVVGDTRNGGLRSDVRPQTFLPYTSNAPQVATLVVRTSVEPRSIEHGVRQQVWAIDRGVAFMNVIPLEDVLYRSALASPSFGVGLMASFAAIGLVLAAIGVFSVMSYTVSIQTHDIGIQMALGAEPSSVVRTIVLRGLKPIAAGVVAGLGAAYGLSRLMANQIYGVTATDPWTFVVVSTVLVIVGIAACLLPALRAARVSPLAALRER